MESESAVKQECIRVRAKKINVMKLRRRELKMKARRRMSSMQMRRRKRKDPGVYATRASCRNSRLRSMRYLIFHAGRGVEPAYLEELRTSFT